MNRQMERELEYLERQLAEGSISSEEYAREVRAIERDYREAAQESARDAYERELERW